MRKRSYGRKRTGRRRVFRRRSGKYIRRTVRRTVRNMAETKFYYQDFTPIAVRGTPQGFTFADGLTTGTGNSQRIGNRISVHRMYANLNVTFQSGSGTEAGVPSAIVRVLCVYPRKGLSGADTQSSLISSITVGSRVDPTRFIILWEKRFALAAASPVVSSGGLPNFRHLKFIKRTKYDFNYSTANLIDREPLMIFVTSITDANPASIVISGFKSMSFKDI